MEEVDISGWKSHSVKLDEFSGPLGSMLAELQTAEAQHFQVSE